MSLKTDRTEPASAQEMEFYLNQTFFFPNEKGEISEFTFDEGMKQLEASAQCINTAAVTALSKLNSGSFEEWKKDIPSIIERYEQLEIIISQASVTLEDLTELKNRIDSNVNPNDCNLVEDKIDLLKYRIRVISTEYLTKGTYTDFLPNRIEKLKEKLKNIQPNPTN